MRRVVPSQWRLGLGGARDRLPARARAGFVLDGGVFDHRRARLNDGLANIDLVIGAWAVRRGIAVWHTTPSLVQHIGESSTIWPSDRADGPRRADRFAGDVL